MNNKPINKSNNYIKIKIILTILISTIIIFIIYNLDKIVLFFFNSKVENIKINTIIDNNNLKPIENFNPKGGFKKVFNLKYDTINNIF